MNTSPVLSLDEQQVEIKTTSMGKQPPEMENTVIEQADPINVQIQDIEENAKLAEVDTSEQQAQDTNTDSQVDEE